MLNINTLIAITWDHPKRYEPLQVTSKEFSKKNPEVFISPRPYLLKLELPKKANQLLNFSILWKQKKSIQDRSKK